MARIFICPSLENERGAGCMEGGSNCTTIPGEDQEISGSWWGQVSGDRGEGITAKESRALV